MKILFDSNEKPRSLDVFFFLSHFWHWTFPEIFSFFLLPSDCPKQQIVFVFFAFDFFLTRSKENFLFPCRYCYLLLLLAHTLCYHFELFSFYLYFSNNKNNYVLMIISQSNQIKTMNYFYYFIIFRTLQNPYENEIFRDNEDEQINLLIIGKNGLGRELEDKIRVSRICVKQNKLLLRVMLQGRALLMNFESECFLRKLGLFHV